MSPREILEFYEKLYCQELEQRSQLLNRMQIPLGVLLALSGVLGYIAQNCPSLKTPVDGILGIFWIAALLTASAVGRAAYYFTRAWWPGTYQALPTALESDQYHRLLESTYDGYEEKDELVARHFEDYLRKYYRDFSSDNAILNDGRTRHLSLCVTWLVWSGGAVALLFLFFQFAEIKSYAQAEPLHVRAIAPIAIEVPRPLELSPLRVDPITVNPLTIERNCLNDKAKSRAAATTATTAAAAPHQRGCAVPTSPAATQSAP